MLQHLVSELGRKAEGWLVQQEELGRSMSARPMASICCWPPESVQPSARSFSWSAGKTV